MRKYFFFSVPILIFLFAAPSCRENAANVPNANVTNANSAANANHNTQSNSANTNAEIPVYDYEIVKSYRHDGDAFTQGLAFHNGWLYESTGQEGESTVRKVELQSGSVKEKRKLKDTDFGEGLTILNDKIYQITWLSGVCYVYDLTTFEQLSVIPYNGEGWGLTNDGTNLIISDGSDKIVFRDPTNLRVIRSINVTHNGKPLYLLNELEFVKGEIWANIWHSEETTTHAGGKQLPNIGKPNYIARINPNDGKVVGWIDLKNISPDDSARDRENTLNGIAYDASSDRIFVTGKNWRKLFEIKLKPSK